MAETVWMYGEGNEKGTINEKEYYSLILPKNVSNAKVF